MNGLKSIIKNFLYRDQKLEQQLTGPCFIHRLPEEVLFIIFEHFDLPVLSQYKRVCKKFYFVINRMKFDRFNTELVVKRIGSEEVTNYWFYTYRPILLKKTLSYYEVDFLNEPSFIKSFVHLKRLKINVNAEFNLFVLNGMTNLEQLEIDNIINLKRNTLLDLPRLRILSIKIFSNYSLTIDSANLQALKCFKLTNIDLFNPRTIEYIEVEFQNKFENLTIYTHLQVYKVKDCSRLDRFILSKAPTSLKSIHFYYPYQESAGSQVLDEIKSILKEKDDLDEFKNLDVYFQGVKQTRNSVGNVGYMSFASIKYHYENLEDTLEYFDFVNYKHLVEAFDTIPSDFHKKFINIQSIKIDTLQLGPLSRLSRALDQKRFEEFLVNCSSLSSLELVRPSFDQEFYERLTITCPLIKTLKLKETKEISLNYRFILCFRSLKSFSTTHCLTIDEVIKIMTRSRAMEELIYEHLEDDQSPIKLTNWKAKKVYNLIYHNRRLTFEHKKLSKNCILDFLKVVDNEIEKTQKNKRIYD